MHRNSTRRFRWSNEERSELSTLNTTGDDDGFGSETPATVGRQRMNTSMTIVRRREMRHHITVSITSCLLAVLLGAAGCGGPSKAGLEAREQAYGRIDQVNTQISYSQARQSFETGQLRDALDLIQDAVDRYPQSAEYHLLHGRILIELHRLDAARASLEAAIERDDQLHEAHYFLGIVHQRWSEDEEAFAQYQRASELEETKPQYLLAAAESLIALQRYDEAKSLVHHRLRRFEHHPAFRHLLGQIARLQGDLAGAARLYEEASLLQPDDLQLVVEVANAQFAAGDVPGCLDTLRVLEMRGHDFEPQQQLLRARCLVQANRCIDARPLYRALCTEHPHGNSVDRTGLVVMDARGLARAS